MCSPKLLALMLAALVATAGANQEDNGLILSKCCGIHQMLSADGMSCVETNLSGNFSINGNYRYVVPPLDSEWVRRWLPPGLPLHNISKVYYETFSFGSDVVSVNASSWDPAWLRNESVWENTVRFVGNHLVARPKTGGGYRTATYCVDAAPPPLGPFAMQFRTLCNVEECAYKCCGTGRLLRNDTGYWRCESDEQGFWSPSRSSLSGFDSEFPYASNWYCDHPRLLPSADWSHRSRGSQQFNFSSRDTCFDFYRSGNGYLNEGLFYCDYPRFTRGVY